MLNRLSGKDNTLTKVVFLFKKKHTHTQTEGRAPVWGPEFTIQAAKYSVGSAEFEFAAGQERRTALLVRGACVVPAIPPGPLYEIM
jgi:hypothetical protein